MKKLVITGSHATPAEAVAERLPGGIKVFTLADLAGPKLKRYDWHSIFDLLRLPGMIIDAKKKLQRISPDLVLSFGGYAAVPVVLAAKILKIPIVIHEQTFAVGLASRVTAPLASKIAVSWKSSRKYFPKNKTRLTGNPIRRAILKVKRRPEKVIYINGGRQGSRAINKALAPILPELVREFVVYHPYGKQKALIRHKNYRAKAYFSASELAAIYRRAQLVVGRAGINTVTELGYLGIAAVLIPLPYTQKNEQETNARYLEKLGLALVLNQSQLTPEKLLQTIEQALVELPRSSPHQFPRNRVGNAAVNLSRLCLNWL